MKGTPILLVPMASAAIIGLALATVMSARGVGYVGFGTALWVTASGTTLGTCHTVPISRALEVSRRGKRFHHKAEMGRQILFLVCVKTKISFEGNLWAWGSTGVSTDNSGIEFTAVSLLPGLRTVVVWFKPLCIESVT